MALKKISMRQLEEIAKEYSLHACKIKGTDVINIRKAQNRSRYEDIDWDEFGTILKKRRLAVFKDEKSDFLKIKKDK